MVPLGKVPQRALKEAFGTWGLCHLSQALPLPCEVQSLPCPKGTLRTGKQQGVPSPGPTMPAPGLATHKNPGIPAITAFLSINSHGLQSPQHHPGLHGGKQALRQDGMICQHCQLVLGLCPLRKHQAASPRDLGACKRPRGFLYHIPTFSALPLCPED